MASAIATSATHDQRPSGRETEPLRKRFAKKSAASVDGARGLTRRSHNSAGTKTRFDVSLFLCLFVCWWLCSTATLKAPLVSAASCRAARSASTLMPAHPDVHTTRRIQAEALYLWLSGAPARRPALNRSRALVLQKSVEGLLPAREHEVDGVLGRSDAPEHVAIAAEPRQGKGRPEGKGIGFVAAGAWVGPGGERTPWLTYDRAVEPMPSTSLSDTHTHTHTARAMRCSKCQNSRPCPRRAIRCAKMKDDEPVSARRLELP